MPVSTLVIFLADNGTHKSIASRWRGQSIRGGKGLPTDAGTHVPMLAWWPGKITAGTRSDALVEFSDILPTLLDLAGGKLPQDQSGDGVSLLPVLLGEGNSNRDSIFIYSNPRPSRKNFGVHCFARNRKWKLYSDARFYQVSEDRLEKNPILIGSDRDQPEVRALLQKKIDSMPAKGQNLVGG